MSATGCYALLYLARMNIAVQRLAVNIRDAARILSVSQRTIQSYLTANVLRSRRIGRRRVILIHDLEVFLSTDHAPPGASGVGSEKRGEKRRTKTLSVISDTEMRP